MNGTDPMFADAKHDFWVFGADLTGPNGVRDRSVNLSDFNRLAANFGLTPATYSQGDINYDGAANLQDFNILAGRFGAMFPAPPTSPDEITAGDQTASTIQLQWLDTVDGETGYRIQQSTDGQVFNVNYPAPAGNGGVQEFVVPNLQDGKRYWFRVRAFSDSISNPDGPNTAYTPKRAANTVLSAPTLPSATPISYTTVEVAWQDNAQNEAEYRIEYSLNGTTWSEPISVGQNSQTALVSGLLAERSYEFRVYAWNQVTTSMPAQSSATPIGLGTEVVVPIDLTASLASVSQINLSWTTSTTSGAKYNVYRSLTGEFSPEDGDGDLLASGVTGTSYSDSTVQPNTRYYYRITAVTTTGASYSWVETTETTGLTVAPTDLDVHVIDDRNVEVWWTDTTANETSFTLEQSLDGINWTPSEDMSEGTGDNEPNQDGRMVGGLNSDTNYHFRVRANFPGGEFRFSNTKLISTHDEFVSNTVIVAIFGHNQRMGQATDVGQNGVKRMALRLADPTDFYNAGRGAYTVVMTPIDARYRPGLDHNGQGDVMNYLLTVLGRGVTNIVIFGYSHGGGGTYNLAHRLDVFDVPNVRLTAYMDAIRHTSTNSSIQAETRRPITDRHINYWNGESLLHGNFVNGSEPGENIRVTEDIAGQGFKHTTFDNLLWLQDRVIRRINDFVPQR